MTPNLINKKKIIVHIGSPKTGSSALQAFLWLNSNKLIEKGFYYPVDNVNMNKPFQTSSGNAVQLVEYIKNGDLTACIQFAENSIKEGLTTILSSERLNFWFHYKTEFVNKIFENFDCQIICYLRRQDNRLQSSINQRIKYGDLTNKTEAYEVLSEFDYFLQFKKISDYFDKKKIFIRIYEKKQFEGESIFSDFLNCLGIKLDEKFIIPEKNVNPALNHDALSFRLFLNDYSPPTEINEKVFFFKNSLLEIFTKTDIDRLFNGWDKQITIGPSNFWKNIGRYNSQVSRKFVKTKQFVKIRTLGEIPFFEVKNLEPFFIDRLLFVIELVLS
ncbi:MAG: hypothetical protein K9H26_16065 [Prolixibacteraceae bacterium]|nr:hypothetical protein [Prolixibacteraceae bacterium]